MTGNDAWHKADKGKASGAVFAQAKEIEQRQSGTFNRFYKLECLYDPEKDRAMADMHGGKVGRLDENVIATNVDTVAAVVAATEIRPRVQTDGADWQTQRTARELELYGEGLLKEFEVHQKCHRNFHAAAKIGTGTNFVYAKNGAPVVDRVLASCVMVDDRECEYGEMPKTIFRIHRAASKDELIAEYPKHEKAIRASTTTDRRWPGSAIADDVVMIEAWRRKCGKVPGRYVKCIDGVDLEDKPYNKPYFPCDRIVWSERDDSWYGISLAERIAGQQRSLNHRNWVIQRGLTKNVSQTTYVSPADTNLTAKSVPDIGTVAVVRGERPTTVMPPMVNAELYKSREDLKASAGEESGVSRMAAYATKPPGIESGVAMREFRDITTQRFATQEKAYENHVLGTLFLLLEVCKELGDAAPKVTRKAQFGGGTIKWADVDLKDVRIQLAAASTLARTPAGRQQTVLEWAQAGVISMDEARRLMRHPDLERSMSLYTAAVEACEADIYRISKGETRVPGPFMNHKMNVWRGQAQALLWEKEGAPESVLEDMRQYVVLSAWYVSQAEAANANVAPGAPMAEQMPPMPIGAEPTAGPGVAAYSPQSLGLVG